MLTLLVPGVLMGGSPADAGAAANDHFLPILGVGRIFIPFMFLMKGTSWLFNRF